MIVLEWRRIAAAALRECSEGRAAITGRQKAIYSECPLARCLAGGGQFHGSSRTSGEGVLRALWDRRGAGHRGGYRGRGRAGRRGDRRAGGGQGAGADRRPRQGRGREALPVGGAGACGRAADPGDGDPRAHGRQGAGGSGRGDPRRAVPGGHQRPRRTTPADHGQRRRRHGHRDGQPRDAGADPAHPRRSPDRAARLPDRRPGIGAGACTGVRPDGRSVAAVRGADAGAVRLLPRHRRHPVRDQPAGGRRRGRRSRAARAGRQVEHRRQRAVQARRACRDA